MLSFRLLTKFLVGLLINAQKTRISGAYSIFKACFVEDNVGRHQTLDKHVKQNVAWIKTLPGVAKVIIGISESCRHKYPPGHIRFKMDVDGGIKLNAYSGNGVTDLFVKIDPILAREHIKALIAARFTR